MWRELCRWPRHIFVLSAAGKQEKALQRDGWHAIILKFVSEVSNDHNADFATKICVELFYTSSDAQNKGRSAWKQFKGRIRVERVGDDARTKRQPKCDWT